MECDPGGTQKESSKRGHSRQERILLWNHTTKQVKVQWKNPSPEEATWEMESNMQEAYPDLFQGDDMDE